MRKTKFHRFRYNLVAGQLSPLADFGIFFETMTDKESATQRKIFEVRRKISLCEGKRRAVYNLGEVRCKIRLLFSLHFYPFQLTKKRKRIKKIPYISLKKSK